MSMDPNEFCRPSAMHKIFPSTENTELEEWKGEYQKRVSLQEMAKVMRNRKENGTPADVRTLTPLLLRMYGF